MTPEQIQKMADGLPPHSIGKDHEEVVTHLAKQHIALQQQVNALAAENAARGEIIERLIGQFSASGYYAVQNSLNPAQSLLYDAMQALEQPATAACLNSVRAKAISSAIVTCTDHCDTDYVMDAYDFSYEIAEMRAAGAIDLRGELVAYAAELRAGEQGGDHD